MIIFNNIFFKYTEISLIESIKKYFAKRS